MKENNRYFVCSPPGMPNQFLTVTADQAKRIERDPLYLNSKTPVSDWAFDRLSEIFEKDGQMFYDFQELSQEEGDKLQIMRDVLNGLIKPKDPNAK
ncbi:MAG: hypothetical protein AB4352_21245 [Hormoscilla sp.]